MKSKLTKPVALLLCGLLLVGSVVPQAISALRPEQQSQPTVKENTPPAEEPEAALTKDETVYVLAGADGSVEKIIVSDWIQNTLGNATVTDKSQLTDTVNVKGEETYTLGGDDTRVWDAQGKDIYYQGNIQKELPVALSVTYKLDGKPISPEDLAGKSGKVTIRFDYTNLQYEMVEIDGKQEKIYVSFAMITGMLLDNDVFSHVEVSNGKLMNDGDRTIVAGLAFPGLQSNLNLDQEKLEIPSYVEITADVQNFSMMNTVTIATNGIFGKLDTKNLNSVEELSASLGVLTDAMNQLLDGSSRLYDGLCTLLDKSEVLIAGIDQLAEGASKLKVGAAAVDKGAGALAGGAQELANGLDTLDANSGALNAGAKQVFTSLLGMADNQLAAAGLTVPKLTIDNYAQVLNGVIASLDSANVAQKAEATARQAVTEQVNAQKDVITGAVTEAVRQEVTEKVTQALRENVEVQVLAALGMTREQYEAGVAAGIIPPEQQAQIAAAIEAQMAGEEVKAALEAQIAQQMASEEVQALIAAKTQEQIASLIEENMHSPEVQAQITKALEQAASGAAAVSALKEQLDSYNQFYLGLNQYTAGVGAAKKGANQLKDGASALKAGSAELSAGVDALYDGILTLKNGTPALKEGVTQLRDGAMQLADGLKAFNEQGVEKLVAAVDGNGKALLTRIKATVDVAKNYKSFSGITDEMDGQVKFVYRTDSVKAD